MQWSFQQGKGPAFSYEDKEVVTYHSQLAAHVIDTLLSLQQAMSIYSAPHGDVLTCHIKQPCLLSASKAESSREESHDYLQTRESYLLVCKL